MSASFCWECGKPLERRDGSVVFREVTPPGGTPVRVHVRCGENYYRPLPDHVQVAVKEEVRRYIGEPSTGTDEEQPC